MKKNLRIISAILFLTLCFGTFCACGGDVENGNDTVTDSEEESGTTVDPIIENSIKVVSGGTSSYKLIRSINADDDTVKQFIRLKNLISERTGVKLDVADDWLKPGEEVDPEALEILVGNTNRPESTSSLEGLGDDDYSVGVYGNKIVIAARNAAALERAIDQFTDCFTFVPRDLGTDLLVPKDMNITLRHVYPTACTVLGTPLDKFRIIYPENEVYAAERTARLFASFLKTKLGVTLNVLSDVKASADDADAFDIVFGKTSVGGESVTAEHGWTVSASGKKLLVSSQCYLGYEALYDYLTEQLFLGETVEIKDGFSASGSARTEKFVNGTEYTSKRAGEYRVMFSNILGIRDEDEATIKLRTRMIAEVALEYAPDVIGVQECCPRSRGNDRYDGVLTANGYKEASVKFSNSANNNYTPIFYRPDRLEQLDSGYLIYPSTNNTKSYTWVVFRDISNGKTFAVLGTHFKYTGGTSSSSVQTGSVGLIEKAVKTITEKYNCPVFIGGDMNCKNTDDPFKLFVSLGFKDTHDIAERTEDQETEHGYPGYDSKLGIYNTTKIPTGKYSAAIDHALLYAGDGAPDTVTVKVFDVVTDEYALKGSDHCPVWIDFDLK